MSNELRRAKRYSLTAAAEIVDLKTGVCINASTSDLSLVGCYVDTLNPLPEETAVKIRIAHGEETFLTCGIVVYSRSNLGMGIKFVDADLRRLDVLGKWLNKLNGNKS